MACATSTQYVLSVCMTPIASCDPFDPYYAPVTPMTLPHVTRVMRARRVLSVFLACA